MKALWAGDFPVLREFATGSWLGREYQGRGFGKEMRGAVLHLGFEELGAQWAVSQVFADNPASLGVNRHHGYRDDGLDRRVRRGVAADWLRFRLSAEQWKQRDRTGTGRDGFTVEGWDDCAAMFGLGHRERP
jgi:RimJ/RimL family protein N-acetyltransferase